MLIGQKLLRYIDDFLLITPKLDTAQRFVRRMKEGFPEYGAFVSTGKTLLSFECLGAGKMEEICVQGDCTCTKLFPASFREGSADGSGFPYCGFMINMSTLDISLDYSRSLTGRESCFKYSTLGDSLHKKTRVKQWTISRRPC